MPKLQQMLGDMQAHRAMPGAGVCCRILTVNKQSRSMAGRQRHTHQP
jgi:hypothetical protein